MDANSAATAASATLALTMVASLDGDGDGAATAGAGAAVVSTTTVTLAVAESTVRLGLSLGYNHIDAALDYKNQRSVGKALAEHDRASYFLTTKVPSRTSASSAFADTSKDLAADLEQLGLSYVDLMLVHFPPVGNTLHCAAMQEQWRALETFYRAKKAPRHRRRI